MNVSARNGSTIYIHVDGIPKGQPRARAFAMRFGDKVSARMYDPGTAENWKSCIALAAHPFRPASPVEHPVRVRIAFFLPRPARLCRRKDLPGLLWHDGPGDADNFAKAVLDCLTQLGWWRDDRQVVDLHVTKHYHAKGGRPGADIEITPVETGTTQAIGGTSHGATGPATPRAGDHAEDLGAAASPPLRAAAFGHWHSSPQRKRTNP